MLTAKGHIFVRWESETERLNVEATGKGSSRFDDDYYKKWPFPVAEEEIQAESYLKSLSSTAELAVFRNRPLKHP